MPKVKLSEKSNVDVPVTPETPVKAGEEVVYPEVRGTGKFQVVQVGDGYVVYNPDACRVTGILKLSDAEDVARKQNQAARL